MSNANQETIADTVADIRAQNQGLPEGSYALSPLVCDLLSFADRIEAAHQREVAGLRSKRNEVVGENEGLRDACGTCGAKRECEETREKSSQVGNAAKMREALLETKSVIARCMEILNKIPGGVPYDGLIDDVADEICDLRESYVNPALSDPPRNCDVGTVDEQLKRFSAFCMSRKCNECPFVSSTYGECGVRWSQMPYEEGGEK